MASSSIIILPLLLLQLQSIGASRSAMERELPSQTQTLLTNPAVNIYFNLHDLRPGFKPLLYFSTDEPPNSLRLLSRQEADSIPFSSAHLPSLLQFFSFAGDSPQAKAMESTLKQCELEPISGEARFCATSLESMLDFARSVLGPDSQLKVLTTKLVRRPTASLQNYTVSSAPIEIGAAGMVACHLLPYPYAVFYCHSQKSGNRLFRIRLEGGDGALIDASAVCHMDTSHWDTDHVSFRVLRIRPGTRPVCHFFPADNLVWASL